MALGPRQLSEVEPTPEEKALVAKLEKEIDLQLSRQCSTHCSVPIDLSRHCHIDLHTVIREKVVQRELRRRYLAAGWREVKFGYSQRDNDEWIEFEGSATVTTRFSPYES